MKKKNKKENLLTGFAEPAPMVRVAAYVYRIFSGMTDRKSLELRRMSEIRPPPDLAAEQVRIDWHIVERATNRYSASIWSYWRRARILRFRVLIVVLLQRRGTMMSSMMPMMIVMMMRWMMIIVMTMVVTMMTITLLLLLRLLLGIVAVLGMLAWHEDARAEIGTTTFDGGE